MKGLNANVIRNRYGSYHSLLTSRLSDYSFASPPLSAAAVMSLFLNFLLCDKLYYFSSIIVK